MSNENITVSNEYLKFLNFMQANNWYQIELFVHDSITRNRLTHLQRCSFPIPQTQGIEQYEYWWDFKHI